MAEEKQGHVKVYEQKEKSGLPWWLLLLPLLALLGLGLWWFNRPHDTTQTATTQSDNLKPEGGAGNVPANTTANNYTATGIADAFRNRGRLSLSDAEVHFATGSAQLQGDSQAVLDTVAQVMKDDANLKLKVQGFTDTTGTVQGNEQLATNRAQSVATYLTAKGIDKARLTPVQGVGESNKADNSTTMGRAENRRVELIKE